MESLGVFVMGEISRGKEMKVFDWNQAAKMIRESCPKTVSAGLGEDWNWTGGEIYVSGHPVKKEDTYTYLASTWATPEIDIDGVRSPCYKMESEVPGWDSGTFWPESALRILHGTKCAESVKDQTEIPE